MFGNELEPHEVTNFYRGMSDPWAPLRSRADLKEEARLNALFPSGDRCYYTEGEFRNYDPCSPEALRFRGSYDHELDKITEESYMAWFRKTQAETIQIPNTPAIDPTDGLEREVA